MSRWMPKTWVLVGLIGLFVALDVAEARQTRSSVDRRQRPGKGFWAESVGNSRSTRSYSQNGNGSRTSSSRTNGTRYFISR
jgi:hypothetical protein